MDYPELAALVEECTAMQETLLAVPDDAWERPGLGQWTVAQLVAHTTRGVNRITTYLQQPVTDDVAVDRVSYWRYDADAEAPGIAQRAIEAAADVEPAQWPQRFAATWPEAVDAARAAGPAHVLTTIMGPMRLDEYTATRVLEVVVHHMDLRVALDQPPASTPVAARMTMAVLEALLGEPRPRAMGRTRFIQAATGRLAVDDPRFPVLR